MDRASKFVLVVPSAGGGRSVNTRWFVLRQFYTGCLELSTCLWRLEFLDRKRQRHVLCQFFHWLERQRARYVLSLNGFDGDKDCRVDVPEWHYDEHVQIDVGKSPYCRPDDDESPLVTDSLYVRRER